MAAALVDNYQKDKGDHVKRARCSTRPASAQDPSQRHTAKTN